MRVRTAIVVMCVVMAAASAMPRAHHSFSGEFDNAVAVTLHGTISSVEMVNPHSFIYLEVTHDGKVQRWALEGPGPTTIARRGMDQTSLTPGDELGTCGYLARGDVAGTRPEPASSTPARKLSAAVLFLSDGRQVPWSNYRQQKCGLDR